MNGSLIWLEVVLGFAAPLAWGVWQLVSLRRDQREADAQRQAEQRLADRQSDATTPGESSAEPTGPQPPPGS